MNWNTRDWIWLIVFMIFAQGIIVVTKYSQINELISYISTFVSIALAGVAIYISVREATKADTVKDELNTILGEMKEKLYQVDNKVSRLDPEFVLNITDKYKEDTKSELMKKFENLQEVTKENVNNLVNEVLEKNVNVMNQNIEKAVKKANKSNKDQIGLKNVFNDILDVLAIYKYVTKKYSHSKVYPIRNIYNDLINNLNINISERSFTEILQHWEDNGVIKLFSVKNDGLCLQFNEEHFEDANRFQYKASS